MGFLLKLKHLLWKNFLVRRRNKFRFIAELLYPLLIFVILVALKPSSEKIRHPECHYFGHPLPSVGRDVFWRTLLFTPSSVCQPVNANPVNQRLVGNSLGSMEAAETPLKRERRYAPRNRNVSDLEACRPVKSDFNILSDGTIDWDMIRPIIRGKVLYYPDTATTRAIMKKVNDSFNELTTADNATQSADPYLAQFYADLENCVDRQRVQAVTPESAVNEAWRLLRTGDLLAVVVFEDPGDTKLPSLVKYKIRMSEDRLPTTASSSSSSSSPSSSPSSEQDNKFVSYGFAYLQDMIDSAIIEEHSPGAVVPGRVLQRFPEPVYFVDVLMQMLTTLTPLMMVISWIHPFAQTVRSVVLEKEERVKEMLAVMGMGRGVQWTGWMLEILRSAVVTCVLLCIIIKIGGLMPHTDPTVLFVLLVSFIVSMVSFAMLVATFFSKATLAGPAASVIYFLSYLAYQLVDKNNGEQSSFGSVLATCLLSNVALAEGTLVIGKLEENGDGAQWYNFNTPANVRESGTLAGFIGMLWLDAVIYAVLTWYIDNVFPGEYGVPKPYFFFLEKSYWKGTATEEEKRAVVVAAADGERANADNFEPEPEGAAVGVAIKNLSKVFGKKAAVNGLSLNFYKDQINCFLGQNGAGKTTTISMLTGMYTPSAGTAYLNGLDIRTNMDAIRTNMGVCPQHNVLFNSLTVEEHLLFFGRIRGISDKVLKPEIDDMLKQMGLSDKRKSFANTLSGGMKRKLSVGMAFVGGSSVVFLDEPTAGVDPFSRRGIWDLLVRLRRGRTVILTTHFMDEAELLGDRIAIMCEGRLQCCGSSVFLKERLGSGYHLCVELERAEEHQDMIDRRALLLQEVLAVVPAARPQVSDEVESKAAAEVVYILPDRHDVPAMTRLLERLDEQRQTLGIASYAISDTALEEIFVKVVQSKEAEETQSDAVTLEDDASTGELIMEPLTGWSLIKQQYTALTRKRFHYVRRDLKGLFTQIVLPSVFVVVALALAESARSGLGQSPELLLRPQELGKPVVSFLENVQGGDPYIASMLKDGVGTALVGGGTSPRPTNLRSHDNPDLTCTNSPPLNTSEAETLPSGELYYNATGALLDNWIVNSYESCRKNRFGGVSFGACLVLNLTQPCVPTDFIKIWYEGKISWASTDAPAYLNTINNVLLRASLSVSASTKDFGIATSSWPLPADATVKSDELDTYELNVLLSSTITVIFAMSFVPASFVMFLVEERTSQSKHLQLVSGLRPYIYWLQGFSWDLVSFIMSESLVILIFVAFQSPMYTSGTNVIALILLIFFYGLSCTPMLYMFSWLFQIPTMAFLVLSAGNLMLGLMTTVTIMVMKITNPDEVQYAVDAFYILPQFNLGQGLMNMATTYITNEQIIKSGGEPTDSALDWDVTGKHLVAMAVMSVVLAAAVFLAEQSTHWWHGWQQASATTDGPNGGNSVAAVDGGLQEDDVLREQQRVAAGHADNGMLVLKGLTKRYRGAPRRAVDAVSLGVERGQCFGLLGLNGAGKTTIFKMLTGDTLISGGDAMVDGRSVRADMDSVRRLTGYCPQFDALVPLLNVREHLELYCCLRGVPPNLRPSAVRRAIDMMDLGSHEGTQAKALSGGNKRKLSAAIALVGDPALLYMDEPTTSMDPCARRFVWQRVRRVVAAGRSVLLTSHSMEECEALCGSLTIMVNGQLTCLGSPQHLKHKYGSGYIAVVRCPLSGVEKACALIQRLLPGAEVAESHLNQVKFQLPPALPVVSIFRALDEAQKSGHLRDYSVSQTTLEDVFMRFAREQTSESG